ncbi:unnamed protein product [Clonostachys chloroleuca]|uniref:Uncharacterized protein n=1 Tax=Clonostachys chloroleuca TaxID=1926264 RepID=A0AA35LU40_9HYPO|nr:unnamed protein product [Clonostachys chloroleuca]
MSSSDSPKAQGENVGCSRSCAARPKALPLLVERPGLLSTASKVGFCVWPAGVVGLPQSQLLSDEE